MFVTTHVRIAPRECLAQVDLWSPKSPMSRANGRKHASEEYVRNVGVRPVSEKAQCGTREFVAH
eukprot:SAG31_NODE_5303_length_2621_cov_1.705393_3_plen_64_part_00